MAQYGISFTENLGGRPPGEEQAAPGGAPGRSPLQSAVQMLSLRLPRVVGANALAPQALLQGGGGGGAGLSPEVLQQVLARLRMLSGGAPRGPAMPPPPLPGGPMAPPSPRPPSTPYAPPGAGPMAPPPSTPLLPSGPTPTLPPPRFIYEQPSEAERVEKIPSGTGPAEPPLLQPGPFSPNEPPIEPAGPGGDQWELYRALERLRSPGLSPY